MIELSGVFFDLVHFRLRFCYRDGCNNKGGFITDEFKIDIYNVPVSI